jgi:hypothetical protein
MHLSSLLHALVILRKKKSGIYLAALSMTGKHRIGRPRLPQAHSIGMSLRCNRLTMHAQKPIVAGELGFSNNMEASL